MKKISKKMIEQIFNDWDDKPLDLEKMKEKYCVRSDGYVVFSCYIKFKRGNDYHFRGLLTKHQIKYVIYMFTRGFVLHLGEINGKHSEIDANITDFDFNNDPDIVEDYILNNQKRTDIDFFGFYDNDCIDWCKSDIARLIKIGKTEGDHRHDYDENLTYDDIDDNYDKNSTDDDE